MLPVGYLGGDARLQSLEQAKTTKTKELFRLPIADDTSTPFHPPISFGECRAKETAPPAADRPTRSRLGALEERHATRRSPLTAARLLITHVNACMLHQVGCREISLIRYPSIQLCYTHECTTRSIKQGLSVHSPFRYFVYSLIRRFADSSIRRFANL